MSQCVPSWDLDDSPLHLDLPSQVVVGGWDKIKPASGTLESLVKQAVAADALVPCSRDDSTRVGSCSGATVPGETPWPTSLDTEALPAASTSLWSHQQESSSFGRDDYASVAIPQEEANSDDDDEEEVGKRKQIGGIKSSVLRKRSRAAVHTQSERRRRNKINQRMNTLHKMVSTSTKTDKATMLEEIIEYTKQLQAQVQWMKMSMSQMMTIIVMMQQQQQQQHYLHMATWLFPGMGGVPDYNATLGCGVPPFGMPPFIPPPAMVPMANPSWNIQSMQQGIDSYNRWAALYHQFQHPFASKNDN